MSYDEREYIEDILRSATKDKLKVIVVTAGERVFGWVIKAGDPYLYGHRDYLRMATRAK